MKKWVIKAILFLFCVGFIYQFWPRKHDPLNVYIPEGWVNVSAKIRQSITSDIPSDFFKIVKSSSVVEVLADPKTFRDDVCVFMDENRYPYSHSYCEKVAKSDKGFEEFETNMGKFLNQYNRSAATLIETGTVLVNRTKTIRKVYRFPQPIKDGLEKVVCRTLIYIFLYDDGCIILTFKSSENKWGKYLPIFEDVVAKTVK